MKIEKNTDKMSESNDINVEKRLIVILENAPLEVVKVGNKFELLTPFQHPHIFKKNNKDPDTWIPQMTHLALLQLFDSPLNRASLLQVYIRTPNNVVIEIHPETRIPRTFKRFAGLMAQLLHKFVIKDESGRKLIKVIKSPIKDHLPTSARKFAVSNTFKQMKNAMELVPNNDDPVVVVIGSHEDDDLDIDYVDEKCNLSYYPLNTPTTSAKLCCIFEEAWDIL